MNKHHHITVASYKDENGKSRLGIFAAAKTFSKGGKLELVCALIGPWVPTLTDAKNTLSGADMEYSYGWQRSAHYFAELCKRDAPKVDLTKAPKVDLTKAPAVYFAVPVVVDKRTNADILESTRSALEDKRLMASGFAWRTNADLMEATRRTLEAHRLGSRVEMSASAYLAMLAGHGAV